MSEQQRKERFLEALRRWHEVNKISVDVTIVKCCTFIRYPDGARYGAGML